MALLAKFCSMTWIVEPNEIDSIDSISTAYEFDSVSDDGIKLKPQSVDFKTTYVRSSALPNLNAVIEMWRAHVGTVGDLAITNHQPQLAPMSLRLEKVAVSDIVMDALGQIVKCTLSKTFKEPTSSNEEEVYEETVDSGSSDDSGDSDSGYSGEYQYYNSRSAVNIGASEDDKETKKSLSWGEIDPQYEGLEGYD